MEITLLGYFAIVLTIIFLLFNRVNNFLYAAIFFSGYTGSSVLNVAGVTLQPAFYFFSVYFAVRLMQGERFKIRLDPLLMVFAGYCVLSILFPIILSGENIITLNQDVGLERVYFRSSHIIHICYLIFNLVFLNTLLSKSSDKVVADRLLFAYRWGFISVVAICIYQIFAFRYNLPFDVLFRQSVHGNIQGNRIYGPCIEASMLCYYLIPSVLIVLNKRRSWVDIAAVLGAIAVGVISRSSTFLVGGALLGILLIPKTVIFMSQRHSAKQWCFAFVCVALALCLVAAFGWLIMDVINAFIGKLKQQSASGIERFSYMYMSLRVGLKYPTGVGFGTARSADLFSTWICNVGVLGMALYLMFLAKFALGALRDGRADRAVAYLLVVFLMFVSVPEPYNLFVWFILYYGSRTREKSAVYDGGLKDKAPYVRRIYMQV